MSFTSQSAQGPSQYPSALTQSMTSQNGSMAHSAYRSFNDASYGSPLRYSDVNKPQIYTVSAACGRRMVVGALCANML